MYEVKREMKAKRWQTVEIGKPNACQFFY
jgi:hypothetical protein